MHHVRPPGRRTEFLTPPIATADQFGFAFDGTPDYRSLFLEYGCTRCPGQLVESAGRWEIFGPADLAPFVLPELPPDLRPLTPEGSIFELAIGAIFDASELDGYAAWLNADPYLVAPGSVHRRGEVAVRTFED
jgi:hypothetical protein